MKDDLRDMRHIFVAIQSRKFLQFLPNDITVLCFYFIYSTVFLYFICALYFQMSDWTLLLHVQLVLIQILHLNRIHLEHF